jgi:CCR4-NOT transcription complex subunit 2
MAFRSPYSYGAVPPRAMPPPPPPGSAYAQNQNRQPQPSPGFVTPRGIGGAFPFGVTTASLQQQQQQSNSVQQQQQQQPTAQSQSNIQQPPQSQLSSQQHQTPGSSQLQPPPGILPAPSASSTSEILDPNEFPALGSTAPSQPNSAQPNNLHTSYASQAGQQPQPSAPSNLGAPGGGARDFRPEDFPALGQVQTQQQQGDGLNGFQSQSQEHRANLLSGLSGNAGQRPAPSLEERLQAEKRVRNFIATRAPARLSPLPQLNPPNQNHLSWPQQQQQQPLSQQQQPSQQPQNPAATSANHPQAFSSGPNPNPSQTLSNGIAAAQQQSQPQQQQPLGPPPGVPPPNNPFPNPPSAPQYVARPAQQVLVSPADRWGLLGLLAMIKSSDPDLSVLTVGTDLGTMGLDMNQAGYIFPSFRRTILSYGTFNRNLYSTFITPWSDSSAAHTVEPDFHLPACYNVQPPQPNPAKAASFSDETLFFMFYSSPRDLLQEIAAQEL